jgi:Secretion system C-terminal sorting domain
VVIEDDIVIKAGNGNLNPNDFLTVDCAANSNFMRIEVSQVAGHPFSTEAAAWIEGCPDFTQFNWVNQYFLDDGWPSKDVECLPNVGSYDPNDKTGYPLGYSAAHYIKANTDLEYVIRFQNTGTAPAHKVVIRDTLSKFLEASRLRMGAASHTYTWDITGEGFLEITFDNINLPDSLSDEMGSHGYISFKIAQLPYLSDGTILNNQASIYFDFNAPIVTNKTEHQVKYHFLTVSLESPLTKSGKVAKVYPNPTHEEATFYFPDLTGCENQFILTDLQGKIVRNEAFCGENFYFKRNELGNGVYFLKVIDIEKSELWKGKLVID